MAAAARGVGTTVFDCTVLSSWSTKSRTSAEFSATAFVHSSSCQQQDSSKRYVPHSRATYLAPEAMPTPRFQSFLVQTFGDDDKGKEMINFLHLLLGYSITGDVGGQVLPFLYGVGANGKSALLDVVIKILGDYADVAPPGFLMERGKFNEHSTELTELHGRRLFVCSELKPHDKFDEARVKLLTGGDRLKARRMRQDFFSFEPTHKLWLLGNHRPEVGTGGHAFWRRIRLIPFERVVPDHRKIDNLAEILVHDEGPGILHWMIQGATAYLTTKPPLTGPSVVRTATQAYATTEDHIGRFLAECCITTGNLEEPRDLRVEQGRSTARTALGARTERACAPLPPVPSPPASEPRWASPRPAKCCGQTGRNSIPGSPSWPTTSQPDAKQTGKPYMTPGRMLPRSDRHAYHGQK